MKPCTILAICLGPTGNIQGTYSFLNLLTGLMIKRRCFTELPAPDSVIDRVVALADNNGVSRNFVFANRHDNPCAWPNNSPDSEGLDPTPMAVYPQLPAEMPGVLLSCHVPEEDDHHVPEEADPFFPDASQDIDWSQLADEAADNVDLDNAEHLPPPPEVNELDDNNDIAYVPPPTYDSPFIKQEYFAVPSPSVPSPARTPHLSQIPLPFKSTGHSTRSHRPPTHLTDYHVYTTVAEDHVNPPTILIILLGVLTLTLLSKMNIVWHTFATMSWYILLLALNWPSSRVFLPRNNMV